PGDNHAMDKNSDQGPQGDQFDGTDPGTDPVPQETAQGHGGGKGQKTGPQQIFRGQGNSLQVEPAPIDDGPLTAHGNEPDDPQQEQGLEEFETEALLFHRGGNDRYVPPVEPIVHQ